MRRRHYKTTTAKYRWDGILIEEEHRSETYYDEPTGHHGKGRELQMWSTYRFITFVPLYIIVIVAAIVAAFMLFN